MSEPSQMYGRRPVVSAPKMFGGNAYDGASTDAYSQRWAINETAPDAELAQSLPALRSRSADLARNNPLAYGVVDTYQRNVVGRGPRWRSMAPGIADVIEYHVSRWRKNAGWDGVSSLMDVLNTAISAASICGDVLAIWPDVGDGSEPRIDLVDARRIDTPTDATPECASCRLGVGYDKYGRVLGYYVKSSDEAGTLRKDYRWFPLNRGGRINARMFRMNNVRRPRQSRSVGILAAGMHQFKEIPAYLLTEARRATQASKITFIIETPDPKSISDAFENAPAGTDADEWVAGLSGRSYGNIPDGSTMVLGLGEKGQAVPPPQVNGGVGDYVEAQERSIAPSTGLPFEEAFCNYSKPNYANSRAIKLMARSVYAIKQTMLEDAICLPSIELLIRYLWANGKLGRIAWDDAFLDGKLAWDVSEIGEPTKETKANAEAIATNQKSLQQVTASQGSDWRQVVADNVEAEAYEAELREAAGLPPKVNPDAPQPVQNPNPEAVDPLEPPEDENV